MKAIALLSGGLDSRLSVKIMTSLGIEVLALHFYTPFTSKELEAVEATVEKAAVVLGAQGKVIVLEEDYLAMIKNPANGYGGNLNPCIDCKIFMFRRAKAMMESAGAKFIISGEVLGQRPMSQHKDALARIDKASGLTGLVVRPLCGKIMPVTIPETEGWLDRNRLYDISGRGRKRQIALATELGIGDYPWPAGGCLLTEESFCRKLQNLITHDQLDPYHIQLLKTGRHFRLPSGLLLTLGKNDAQNNKLLGMMRKSDMVIGPRDEGGPYCFLDQKATESDIILAAGIVARYTCKHAAVVIFVRKNGEEKIITVPALDENGIKGMQL